MSRAASDTAAVDVSEVTPGRLDQAGDLLERVLADLSGADGEQDVLVRAASVVADLVDADVVAVCEGGHVRGGVGLGRRFLPERGLARVVRDGGGTFAVPGLGRVRAVVVEVPDLVDVHIVVGRVHDGLVDPSHLRGVQLVARLLGLVALARHGRARERSQRRQDALGAAERTRLQRALAQREQVLTTSVRFQRAVAGRRPLPELLLQIAASSSELLDSRPVSLVLADPRSQMRLRVVAAVGDPAIAPERALAAAAGVEGFGVVVGGAGPAAASVHINGRGVGALVVETGEEPLDAVGATVLRAFAEHASTALSHADTVRVVEAASTDSLTGLPNRATLLRHLEVALRASAGDGLGAAVLFIDLDGFKAINDSLGHAAGDEVLGRVARRLRRCLRGDDFAARLGGDEFAVVVRSHEPERAAQRLAERVCAELTAPVEVHGRSVRVGASIGLAVAAAGVGAGELLRRADSAMYRAKAQGRSPAGAGGPAAGTVVVFAPDVHDADVLRRQLESDLERAVDEEEFELVYQPLVRLSDGAVVGLEALLRWRHRTRGVLEPGAFLAGAERSPVVDALWRWVLRSACEQAVRWRRESPDLSLTVNLSSQHALSRSGPQDVLRALTETGLEPGALVLDVPAQVLSADPDVLTARLAQLRATGARIVLDDFAVADHVPAGTAGPSLAALRWLPVDGLKLDRSLVAELDGEQAPAAVAAVRTLCELGAALDLGVVAEGVESTGQVRALQEAGCAVAQGLLLGVPRAAGEVPAALREPVAGSVPVPVQVVPPRDVRRLLGR
ncbi:putative bifunctional diguanylate cyclase/phosphodiesterase [Kineococcus arenarius]|uniref:putative bifunctional diguanylate cyclase/phosphodiesterase n=1 Tax=Kineococcus sp. SYSU DK021 TaxID=3383142 RepID=UPI003D7D9884